MKAAIVERPGELRVRDLSMPVPGPYEVLTEQLFGGICAATDRHLVAGELPIPGIAYPLILGHESIGRVVDKGASVRHLSVGDLVTRTGAPALDGCQPFWGGLAEFGIGRDVKAMQEDGLPEPEWAAFAVNRTLPAGTDPAAATMMITWRETHSYISRLGIPAGARVLILGSGGNGFSFAVLAGILGASRIAMVGSPSWRTLAAQAGVADFVDYHEADIAGTLRAAGVDGVDVIIDAVGHTGGWRPSCSCSCPAVPSASTASRISASAWPILRPCPPPASASMVRASIARRRPMTRSSRCCRRGGSTPACGLIPRPPHHSRRSATPLRRSPRAGP